MKLNRRSVLGAIGLVGVGTGAAFGSGAFTSTTAERGVEVNVFGADLGTAGDGLADTSGNQNDEDNLADAITSDFADVLVNTDEATVDVRDADDNLISNPGNLFPSFESESPGSNGDYDGFNDNYVSLVANDVRVVFGADGGLPPESTLNYDPLFGFTSRANVDVYFNGNGVTGDGRIITNVGGQTNFGDEDTNNSVFSGAGGSSNILYGDIATGSVGQRNRNLNIIIADST